MKARKTTGDPTNNRICSTDEPTCSEFKEAANLFKALSDEVRLAILKQLRQQGETRACEFSGCCGLSLPPISYHLKALREAGLVETEKRGSWAYYRLNVAKVGLPHNLLLSPLFFFAEGIESYELRQSLRMFISGACNLNRDKSLAVRFEHSSQFAVVIFLILR